MSRQGGGSAIGVGVSDTIPGPYKDALGRPLLSNSKIDPTVFIDDDNQAYMYWGNPGLDYVRLNKDMISYSGGINAVSVSNTNFQALLPRKHPLRHQPVRHRARTYRGIVMDTQDAPFTNHPAIITYKGGDYFFYHNGALPGGSGYQRSIAVEKFGYGPNSAIPNMRITAAGAPQIGALDPYFRVEAGTIAFSSGLMTVKGVDFGAARPASVNLRVAGGENRAKVELRLGARRGR
ncbi:glycosyl hydrolase [Schizothecium vesticola]|uniref:Glycosyl hydrolase n=1 Tax=Schizothecium vesticola TaxID=314040 RepID=A0AA40ELI5_9PEZI|nr:glycosyl hydrolase [Schizothecium vesticola]